MKKRRKLFGAFLSMLLSCSLLLGGCGGTDEPSESESASQTSVATADESSKEQSGSAEQNTDAGQNADTEQDSQVQAIPEGDYLEVALNVYYNDSETKYFSNEGGKSIYVTGEGQYTVSFDCTKDLSDAAKTAGVKELKNLTAIYLLDMGVAKGEQSPLTACDIRYDAVTVDGTALTVTQEKAKSAFKSNGVFDTNDPINAWDGSMVAEVSASSDHAANFTTVTNPEKISVTFTLSNMVWGKSEASTEKDDSKKEQSTQVVYVNNAKFSDTDFTKIDALTLTQYMGNGINLGNTMEAYGHATLGTKAGVSAYETYWGEPVTTAEIVQGMKNCGFDTIRIPVSWTNTMDYESGDYTISKAYLDRVEEIVNYALDTEMFVIINDHWDGGWWAMFGSSTQETVDKAWTIYESIWTQVADRFKDYSDMLIFESANEELGDSLNNNSEWIDSGKKTKDECYQLTNAINQRFVDLVRESGGNNDDRFLLIAGYNTDFDHTVDDRFKMPVDSATSKLLLSVHYYSPWTYCGGEKQAKWGLQKEYDDMNGQFAKLEKFTKAGYGVIIGEYGALPIYHSDNASIELKENTIEYTTNLLNNCDIYNYCPLLWSCNDFYNRKTCAMYNEELADLFLGRRYEVEDGSDSAIAAIKAEMEKTKKAAPAMWQGVATVPTGAPVAWIMWNGGAGTYSVGDTYNPADNTAGIVAHTTMIKGAGEYTVSLDFEDGNNGLTFAALAIANGETLFGKPIISIKSIKVDGRELELLGDPYTSSDDKICTRVNLYNAWVNKVPDDARNESGDLSNATPVLIDKTEMVGIYNITIDFEVIINR